LIGRIRLDWKGVLTLWDVVSQVNYCQRIPLASFGAVTGFVFERGGAMEMVMTFLEMSRLLAEWVEHEQTKRKPDPRTLAALEVLASKVYKFDAKFVLPLVTG
jgi:hypothetical protein